MKILQLNISIMEQIYSIFILYLEGAMGVVVHEGFGVGHKKEEFPAPLLVSCITWEVTKPL